MGKNQNGFHCNYIHRTKTKEPLYFMESKLGGGGRGRGGNLGVILVLVCEPIF